MIVKFVGGPAHGHEIDDYNSAFATINVPVAGKGGYGSFQYTLRKCRDANGGVVLILAPAGRLIDPAYLATNKLTN